MKQASDHIDVVIAEILNELGKGGPRRGITRYGHGRGVKLDMFIAMVLSWM